jgi:hypothetical protein
MLNRSFTRKVIEFYLASISWAPFFKKSQNDCTLIHAESLKPWRTYSGALPLIP